MLSLKLRTHSARPAYSRSRLIIKARLLPAAAAGPASPTPYIDEAMPSVATTTDTGITDQDVVWFTCGDCHTLALEINRLTGWPIHSFLAEGRPDLHAFVVPREGWRLDVNGLAPAQEHNQRWECAEHRLYSDDEFMDIWANDGVGVNDALERAREIAPLLIAQARDALATPERH